MITLTMPTTTTRAKFATQVNPDILVQVRMLAEKEGRQLQALVDEALADLLEHSLSQRGSITT